MKASSSLKIYNISYSNFKDFCLLRYAIMFNGVTVPDKS